MGSNSTEGGSESHVNLVVGGQWAVLLWFPGILLGGHYDGLLVVFSSGSVCEGG